MSDHETELRAELLDVIRDAIRNHPRSLQAELGPSEVGHPCPRFLAHKMLGTEAVNDATAGWRPTVGTAVHHWLATEFEKRGYQVERRVAVGFLEGPGGYLITGSSDLFAGRTVVDWKVVGKHTLTEVRRHGPSDQYRVQGHLYCKGWRVQDVMATGVAIVFLPASGELSETVVEYEPYDPALCEEALRTLNSIKTVTDKLGTKAPEVLPGVEHYCRGCPFYEPGTTDLTRSCPGKVTAYSDVATQLAA